MFYHTSCGNGDGIFGGDDGNLNSREEEAEI